MNQISISVAGAGSSSSGTGAGVLSILADVTTQNNYIDSSDINVGSLSLDADKTLDTIAVTGAIAVAAGSSGVSVGLSAYASGVGHVVNNYIKNSNVTSDGDVSLTSDFKQTGLSIIFGGSGGGDLAVSGALSVIANNSENKSYIIADSTSTKKTITSTNGKVLVHSKNDIDTNTIDGNIVVSVGNVSAGAAINTTIYSSEIDSYLKGVDVTAKTGIDINANSTSRHESTEVGASISTGSLALQGSVDTFIINQNIKAYIEDSNVTLSDTGDVNVLSQTDFKVYSRAGAVSVSTGGAGIGGSIITGVVTNKLNAYIENSDVTAKNGNVTVKTDGKDTLGESSNPILAMALAVSANATGAGLVDTIVLNSTSKAYISGKKTNGIEAQNIKINSYGTTNLFVASGGIGVSSNGAIGATIGTIVISKDIESYADNTKLIATNQLDIESKANDSFETWAISGTAAGQAAGSGIIGTNVISSTVKSEIKNKSEVSSPDIDVITDATSTYKDRSGALAAAGVAGAGITVATNVIKYNIAADIDNSTVKEFTTLDVNATSNETLGFTVISGGIGGTVGVGGAVSTNVVNNTVNAYANGTITEKNNSNSTMNVKAKDSVTFDKSEVGSLSVGGTAGVGASIQVDSVTSTVLSHIGGKIQAGTINVTSDGSQTFNGLYLVGFAAGTVGISGSVLVLNLNDTIRAYTDNVAIGDTESNIVSKDLSIKAANATNIDEFIGTITGGVYAAVGASVGVNNITNIVEAYTGANNKITNTGIIDIQATSENIIGKNNAVNVVAGGGAIAAVAGAVLVNDIEDSVKAYIGNENVIKDATKLNITSNATSEIYDGIGGVVLGIGAAGASVGVNTIQSTSIAAIGPYSTITMENGDITLDASSKEILNNKGIILGGGGIALNGGVLYNTIGKMVGNAESIPAVDSDTSKLVDSAIAQKNKALSDIQNKKTDAQASYKKALDNITNIEAEKPETKDLFKLADESGSMYKGSDREKTTSAFVDNNTTITSKNLTITSKDTDNAYLNLLGATAGGLAIGVSAGVLNVYTTTNAFISNNANITTSEDVNINANSTDTQKIDANAGSGGIISATGVVANIDSKKTTNSYILDDTKIASTGDTIIKAISNSDVTSNAFSVTIGGVSIGLSGAKAMTEGFDKINLGKNVQISSNNLTINSDSTRKSTTSANATSGALIGGTGASTVTLSGQDNSIKIGSNVNLVANNAIDMESTATNNATAKTDGRAYGAISQGQTTAQAKINHTGGVSIDDASDTTKNISGKSIKIYSTTNNTTDTKMNAGAGAAIGATISEASSTITSADNVSVGKNYNVLTSNGIYDVKADAKNIYKTYNDSSAYGLIGAAIATITNTITSTVSAKSFANVTANGRINILANNVINKPAENNYDLFGGSGGIVGVGCASITDTLTATTTAELAGDKAYSTGAYFNGDINVVAKSNIDVNEKVDVTAGGAIPISDGDVKITTNNTTLTTISNKDIKTIDDDITFLADSFEDLYAKSNVNSYGGIAVASGSSKVISDNSSTKLIIKSGVNSESGRETYLQALNTKNIESYIYAVTKGLIGAVGGSTASASNDSSSVIDVQSGSYLKSYDSMNLTSLDTTRTFRANRIAEGTTRLVFGIPIVIHGKDTATKKNYSSGSILLNGTLESGMGSKRSLTINKDGTYDSKGINVLGKEKVGTISNTDIDNDIQVYKTQKEGAIKEANDFIATENTVVKNAQATSDNAKTQKDSLVATNNKYQSAIVDAQSIITNTKTISTDNSKISDMNKITSAFDSAYNDTSKSVADSFGTAIQGSSYTEVNTAWTTYSANKTAENLATLKTAVDTLKTSVTSLTTEVSNLQTQITTSTKNVNNIDNTIDCSKEDQLNSFVSACNSKISTNNTTINNYQSTIDTATADINKANSIIAETQATRDEVAETFDRYISLLEQQKASSSSGLDIYTYKIGDIQLRSGNVNIVGKTTGTGSIITAGNDFSVDIINNGVNNVQYGNIQIDRNLQGIINASDIASTIKMTTKSGTPNYLISIKNTVDHNDPTVDMGNNAGDIILQGKLDNVNGTISLTNYTGNIISNGSITSKNLKIVVPNGGYNQDYTSNAVSIGGTSGTGSIVASGDINIAAKTINVNGLIQSGSEIKSVTIPDFTVVKEGDTYYQVVNGVRTKMEKGTTDGYYYLTLGDSTDVKQIKAYFNPTDISNSNDIGGNINLFKTEVNGGNITLTGNIISNQNTGKIVLVNGYGHIDVTNNSKHPLITSALNADNKVESKLTINDFKLSSGGDTTFDNINQNTLTAEYLAQHAGKYEVSVDNNGNVVSTSSGITSGNGNWGNSSKTTRADSANVYTTAYVPGADAYVLKKAASTERHEYTYYVKRSWFTELFCGKLYQTAVYYTTSSPVYETAQNPITVQFQGFDAPKINITSQSPIILNSNITALTGDVILKSTAGDILTNNTNNTISASNILLTAQNDIGTYLKPIQVVANNNGTVETTSNNVYLNYPYTNVTNLTITAKDEAYLSTPATLFGGPNSVINITANALDINAEKGSVDLNIKENSNIDINVKKIGIRAKGDIALTNDVDLAVSSIVSEDKGTVTLGSINGSILSEETETYSPYNINAGNIVLEAENGKIGTKANPLLIANDGIYYAVAKSDINLYSPSRIYVDLIKSETGKVNLTADYGIIASKSSDDLIYNIYSNTGADLYSKSGNIENIAIDTNGTINASAGYMGNVATGMSDVSISLVSQKPLTDEETQAAYKDEASYNTGYNDKTKNMLIGTIKASKNVILRSEKAILNKDENSSITGEKVILTTSNGNIGASDSALKLNINRDFTAYAGNKNSVYITSSNADKDLQINEVRSYISTDKTQKGSLENAILSAAGNITNATLDKDDNVNVTAKNITLNTPKDIGTKIKYFTVDTLIDNANEGLSYSAQNAYIKGFGENFNIVSSGKDSNAFLSSANNTAINIQKNEFNNLSLETPASVTGTELTVKNNLDLDSKKVSLTDLNLGGNLNGAVDDLYLTAKSAVKIESIKGKTTDYIEKALITSEDSILNNISDVILKDPTVDNDKKMNIKGKDIDLVAINSIGTTDKPLNLDLCTNNLVSLAGGGVVSVKTYGAPVNYNGIVAGELDVNTTDPVNIDGAIVNFLNINTTTKNVNIENSYIVKKANITTADKYIVINNLSIAPVVNSTLQIQSGLDSVSLHLDGSKNINIPLGRVLRHDKNITLNHSLASTGMEQTANNVIELEIQNSNVSKKQKDETKSLYVIPTVQAYVASVVDPNLQPLARVRLINGEILSNKNVMGAINTLPTPNSSNIINVNNKTTK